jgi:hypothetical protein
MANRTEMIRLSHTFGSMETGEHHGLVASYPCGSISLCGVHTPFIKIRLGPCNKERTSLVQCIPSGEIDVPPIRDIECARFRDKNRAR